MDLPSYLLGKNAGGGGGTSNVDDIKVNGTSILDNKVADIMTEGVYDPSTNKIATMNDLPSVPNVVILTETEYNNLPSYEDNTEYHIIEG